MPDNHAPWEQARRGAPPAASPSLSTHKVNASSGNRATLVGVGAIAVAVVMLITIGAALNSGPSEQAAPSAPTSPAIDGGSQPSSKSPPPIGGAPRKSNPAGKVPVTPVEKAEHEALSKATNLANRVREVVRQGREPRYLTGGPDVGGCGATMQESLGVYYNWKSTISPGRHGKRFRITAELVLNDSTIPAVVHAEFDLGSNAPELYYD